LRHGSRQVRIGPVAFWIVVGTLVVMGVWTVSTATYFAFRDDVLTRLIARQADMQFAYEDRIADLRAQVDRISSRQLLDQEQYEQKLDGILKRQATLEARSNALGSLPDPTVTGSTRPLTRSSAPAEPTPLKPSPINDTVIFVAPPDREARLESRVAPSTTRLAARTTTNGAYESALTRLQASLDRVEQRQNANLAAMEETFDSKARRIRGVLADLGVEAGKPPAPVRASAGIGGPFIPAKPSDAATFERQLYRISVAKAQVEHLTRRLSTIPVRAPMSGDLETSSGFGVRTDPFLGRPAMHSGLDFRGDTGEAARATAAGTVAHAGWSGGYGNMVEIDHGGGFATRYGHLSAIDVKVGQSVKIGQIVGRVGSTGRSTGPHLHYETRIDGDAVDPQRFLRAGIRLGNLN